jgi:hypothetical protein
VRIEAHNDWLNPDRGFIALSFHIEIHKGEVKLLFGLLGFVVVAAF